MSKDKKFIYWMGVVESRQDVLKLGRCKVRIFGEDTASLGRDSLPYAVVSNSPNIRNNKTPYEGDWVWGFYMDGNLKQQPVIAGIIPGINSEMSIGESFSDTRTEEEILNSPSAGRYPLVDEIGKPSTSKYYRGEDIDGSGTLLTKIKTLSIKDIPTADKQKWSQPEPSYNAQCPYNSVQETESGHLFEMDDTPKHERINIAHRTGTYTEYRPDGSMCQKVEGKNYTIIADDNNVAIAGNCNVTVSGNVTLNVSGNVIARIIGTTDIGTQGNVKVFTQGKLDVTSEGNMTISSNGSITMNSPSEIKLNTPVVKASKDIVASKDIYDAGGSKSMSGMRATFDSHKHPETQSITKAPIESM